MITIFFPKHHIIHQLSCFSHSYIPINKFGCSSSYLPSTLAFFIPCMYTAHLRSLRMPWESGTLQQSYFLWKYYLKTLVCLKINIFHFHFSYSLKPATDTASTRWLDSSPGRPNGVTTTGGRPPRPNLTHLKPLPLPHLTFSLQFHIIIIIIV